MKYLLIAILLIFQISCQSQNDSKVLVIQRDSTTCQLKVDSVTKINAQLIIPEFEAFDRTDIRKKIQNKIDNNIPLVAHVFVPLCDNINQGIVPTSKSLGDGFSLRTNLYWATTHGMKRYFKELPQWKLLKSIKYDADSTILERVVFKRLYKNGATVYLIADAYRGDKMKPCLLDYFHSLSGELIDSVFINEDTILINSKADLLAFNGHNGLMDVDIENAYNIDQIQKDAVVISCASASYFNSKLNFLQAYPLVMTTNLLYPGAFVLGDVLDSWVLQKTDEEIRLSAGNAYHRIKKCGLKGARNLFSTGW